MVLKNNHEQMEEKEEFFSSEVDVVDASIGIVDTHSTFRIPPAHQRFLVSLGRSPVSGSINSGSFTCT